MTLQLRKQGRNPRKEEVQENPGEEEPQQNQKKPQKVKIILIHMTINIINFFFLVIRHYCTLQIQRFNITKIYEHFMNTLILITGS